MYANIIHTMKKVMFSSFNFNLELILEDKFQIKKISSKLKLKEENITFFIVYRFN